MFVTEMLKIDNQIESDIIKQTKEYAEINGIHFDEDTESLILNAMRELHSVLIEKSVICNDYGKYKKMQGNGILHQLCECGE